MATVSCDYCSETFERPLSKSREAIKFGWKQFCSSLCLRQSRNKQKKYICSNPLCKKEIYRTKSQIPQSGKSFCSQSCAASINNRLFPKKRQITQYCNTCGQPTSGRRKYCSAECIPEESTLSSELIIEKIRVFYKLNGRVPYKDEFPHTKAARLHFGSWNAAIIKAGLKPNPILFSKKHVANDGHACDSLSEKIIDDWLFSHNLPHKRNAKYPNSRFTADFQVKEVFIEFFGLHGQLKRYDKSRIKKLHIARSRNIKVIQLYKKDLWPIQELNKSLGKLLEE